MRSYSKHSVQLKAIQLKVLILDIYTRPPKARRIKRNQIKQDSSHTEFIFLGLKSENNS